MNSPVREDFQAVRRKTLSLALQGLTKVIKKYARGKKGGTTIPISAIAAIRSSLQVNISSQAPAGNTCVQCPSGIKCSGIPLPGAFLWK